MIETNKYFKCAIDTPRNKKSSVIYDSVRLVKAEEQAKLPIVELEMIIKHTNDFLNAVGMKRAEFPKIDLSKGDVDYKVIKENNCLQDERDIVWMKFTKDQYLGVVAASNDINFDIPKSESDYVVDGKRAHTTAGIIIHHLGKEWDESFVLVFPLHGIPEGMTRHHLEMGIGNYLIAKGVPILDFWSHNY